MQRICWTVIYLSPAFQANLCCEFSHKTRLSGEKNNPPEWELKPHKNWTRCQSQTRNHKNIIKHEIYFAFYVSFEITFQFPAFEAWCRDLKQDFNLFDTRVLVIIDNIKSMMSLHLFPPFVCINIRELNNMKRKREIKFCDVDEKEAWRGRILCWFFENWETTWTGNFIESCSCLGYLWQFQDSFKTFPYKIRVLIHKIDILKSLSLVISRRFSTLSSFCPYP